MNMKKPIKVKLKPGKATLLGVEEGKVYRVKGVEHRGEYLGYYLDSEGSEGVGGEVWHYSHFEIVGEERCL